jgi:F0F1-type ATP synthase alpha subunit
LIELIIFTRDAYSADISNLHASLLERSSYSKIGGSISLLPIIETINNDVSEYIATNVTSITDSQLVMNKTLSNLLVRPAIDSSLSVSRVGSNSQCRLIKLISSGIKNELTTLRNNSNRLTCLNHISYQDHLFISEIETSLILLLVYRNGILFNNLFEIHKH